MTADGDTQTTRSWRWGRISALLAAAVVLLFAVFALLIVTIDLGRFKGQVETSVSQVLGREFRTDGPLSIEVGRTIRISANDVFLASAGWDDGQAMLAARRVKATIRTASLVKGPVRIEDLELEHLRLRLVSNDAGEANWDFGAGDRAEADGGGRRRPEPPVIIERFDVRDATVSLATPDTALEIVLRAIEHAVRDERLVTRISGSVNDVPLTFEGDIGPRAHVRRGGDVTFTYGGSLGEIGFEAAGSADDLFEPRRPSLDLELRGPNVDYLFDVLGVRHFTSGPLDIAVDLLRADGQTQLGVEGQVGEFHVAAKGYASDLLALDEARISVAAEGPNIGHVGELFGFDRLPETAFSIDGRLGKSGEALTLENIELEIGESNFVLDGRMTGVPRPESADVVLHLRGNDIAKFRELLGYPGVLTGPFDLTAALEAPVESGERIGLRGRVGEIAIDVDLFPSIESDFVGSRAVFDISGPSLATIGEAAGDDRLPGLPFTLAGSAEYRGDRVSLDGVTATLAEAKAQASGAVDLDFPGNLTDLNVHFVTADLARFLGNFGIEGIPAADVDYSSRLYVRNGNLFLSDIESDVGEGAFSGSAVVALEPFASTVDFDLEAREISLQAIVPASDAFTPADLRLTARVDAGYSGRQLRFRRVNVEAGDASVDISGVVDLPPGVTATELTYFADVPSIAALGSSDRVVLPALPLTLSGRLDGQGDTIVARDTRMTIGDNVIAADFGYAGGDRPSMGARVTAPVLDLRPFTAEQPEEETAAPGRREKRDRVIPDLPLPVDVLDKANLDVEMDIGSLATHRATYRDVMLAATLDDRELVVETFGVSGRRGRLRGEMVYKPGADGWLFDAVIRGDELVFASPTETEEQLRERPAFSLDAEFNGRGANLRDLLATLDGRVLMHSGAGVMPAGSGRFVKLLFGDFATELLQTINPLARSSSKTSIECAVLMLQVDEGVVAGNPALVMQTDMLNIFAKGQVNLATEAVDFDFNTQQRKGIGLSIGDLVNPYTKVGGTLASPMIRLDETGAIVEGGAAFATGGLTVIAKALSNRFLSDPDPCATALATYREAVEAATDQD